MSTTDVSILVTQPSPEVPHAPSNRLHSAEATLVHVLVHRESEEYQSTEDISGTTKTCNSKDIEAIM